MTKGIRHWFVGILLVASSLTLTWLALVDHGKVHAYRGSSPPQAVPLSTSPRVALVLGGGGPRGFAHVGVLQVLAREGIKPDLIVGSSMGSLIGALYAHQPDVDALTRQALQALPFTWRELTFARRPWLKGDMIEAQLRAAMGEATLEQMAIPLAVVATSMENGEPLAFTKGDVATAVRASTAIPGMFKRVDIAGREYIDGDVSAPVPVCLARALGATVVIAVDVMSHPAGMPAEMRDYPDYSMSDFYRHAINLRELPHADVVIEPAIGYYVGMDEDERRRVIAAGVAAAEKALPALRAALANANAANRQCPISQRHGQPHPPAISR